MENCMKIELPEVLLERVEQLETWYREKMPELVPLIRPCFLNTIETTIQQLEDGSYFVITGDIPAMWLRDSAAQVVHYIPYAARDEKLKAILEGIIQKQAELVSIDPYANAFNAAATGAGHKDDTIRNPSVWERKYETDSLCAPVYLLYSYWKVTGNTAPFTKEVKNMFGLIRDTFRTEQDHTKSEYRFQRHEGSVTDTLPENGKGTAVGITGMTWSGFRPSDDCCTYGYLIPANMMAVVALRYGAEMSTEIYQDAELAASLSELAAEIDAGIHKFGIVNHPVYGEIFAYETDGLGSHCLMDDANSPSLLAMPYLGYCDREDVLYQNTRRFLLSEENPYYYQGTLAQGMGSPHTPQGYVWHIGITMQALTSGSKEEIQRCLHMLADTHAGTNFMHESFDPSHPEQYTRSWFAWANSLFALLLDRVSKMDVL